MWILEHLPAREEWTKTFPTEKEAVAELRKHICSDCMRGDILVVDSDEESGLSRERLCDPPDPESARDLLSTPCGCEYSLALEIDMTQVSSAVQEYLLECLRGRIEGIYDDPYGIGEYDALLELSKIDEALQALGSDFNGVINYMLTANQITQFEVDRMEKIKKENE